MNDSFEAGSRSDQMSGDICPHGNFFGSVCESCVNESRDTQPAWGLVGDLKKQSKYERSADMPECRIEREGRMYDVSMVRSDDEKTIQEVQKLLSETFGEDEVDPVEYLRAGLDGKTPDGEQDQARYRLFVAKDESGKIQSMYAGGLIGLQDSNRNPTGEVVFMGA